MRGRLLDFATSRSGKQRITIEIDQDFSEGFDNLFGKDVNLSIKRWRNTRSLDANAYFHALASQIAECMGLSLDEVKRQLAIDHGTVGTYIQIPADADISQYYPYYQLIREDVNAKGNQIRVYALYKHTSDMDSKEFSRLLDGTIEDAKALGIDTDTPAQKAILKGDKNEIHA